MRFKIVAVIAATALSASAFAQDKAAPKASTAEVRKLIDSIRNDKVKFSLYCELLKVREGYQVFVERQDDPRLNELDKRMEELTKKLGPDFAKIAGAELNDEGEALFKGLAGSCPSST